MFRSLRTRLAAAAVFLVLLTAGTLMWFAHRDTITALRYSERRTLNNIMFLLERDLAAAHGEALRAKARAVESVKERLRAASRAAFTVWDKAGKTLGDKAVQGVALWAGTPMEPDMTLRLYRQVPDGTWVDAMPGTAHDAVPGTASNRLPETTPGTALRAMPGTAPNRLPDAAPGTALRAMPPPHPVSRTAAAVLPTLASGEGGFVLDKETEALTWVERHGSLGVSAARALTETERSAARNMGTVSGRFKDLLASVSVQETGYAAVFDSSGALVAGPAHAVAPAKLKSTLAAGTFGGVSRRVMVLPENDGPGAAESLYLISYFRPLGWHLVLSAPLEELEAPAVSLVSGQLWITLAVTFGGLLIGLVLAAQITRPVRRLTAVARDLPRRDIMALDAAALEKELPSGRRDEVGELARAFGHMAGELHDKVLRLLESTAARERMERELQVARDIQYGILPGAFTGNERVDLFASMRTAKAVGGDLYDFFFLDEDRLCFVIGDVSDKSIPAALFMSMTVTLLRATMREPENSPAAAMARINDALAKDNPRNMFVTLIIAILDLPTGRVEWTSAGHPPPVLVNRDGAASLSASEDMMAGVFDGVSYKLMQCSLKPGDALFLYTDGVSEAMNAALELFGEDRLIAELSRMGASSVEDMAEGVYAAVQAHAAGEEQSDDIAVVAVRYRGP